MEGCRGRVDVSDGTRKISTHDEGFHRRPSRSGTTPEEVGNLRPGVSLQGPTPSNPPQS